MVRFIIVCMGIVALSLLSMAAQFMADGISDARQAVTARNTPQEPAANPEETVATTDEPDMTPEALNAIESAAGVPSYDPNDNFTSGFTDVAPKGLEDDAPAGAVETPAATEPAAF